MPPWAAAPEVPWSGRFSSAFALNALQKLRVVSWNSLALLAHSRTSRQRRLAHLRYLLATNDIIALQETHSACSGTSWHLHKLGDTHTFFTSDCDKKGSGGILTAVRKSLLIDATRNFEKVVAGRASRLVISKQHSKIYVWCVHNFDLSTRQVRNITQQLSADGAAAFLDPQHSPFSSREAAMLQRFCSSVAALMD